MVKLNPNQCPNRSYTPLYGDVVFGSHEFFPTRLVYRMDDTDAKFPSEYMQVVCKYCLEKRYV